MKANATYVQINALNADLTIKSMKSSARNVFRVLVLLSILRFWQMGLGRVWSSVRRGSMVRRPMERVSVWCVMIGVRSAQGGRRMIVRRVRTDIF